MQQFNHADNSVIVPCNFIKALSLCIIANGANRPVMANCAMNVLIMVYDGQHNLSYNDIIARAKCSKRTAINAVKALIDNHLLKVYHQFNLFGNQINNIYSLTAKAEQLLGKYYQGENTREDNLGGSAELCTPYKSKLSYNYKYNKTMESESQILVADSSVNFIDLALKENPELDKATSDAGGIDLIISALKIKPSDLSRAIIHDANKTLNCLLSLFYFNKFTARKIENPSAFFAWLRWKATLIQRQEFIHKAWSYYQNRAELSQLAIDRAKNELIKSTQQATQIQANLIEIIPNLSEPDERLHRKLSNLWGLTDLFGDNFATRESLRKIKLLGIEADELILKTDDKNAILILTNQYIKPRFIKALQGEFNKNIRNFKFSI